MKRLKEFIVDGKKYIFNGNTVELIISQKLNNNNIKNINISNNNCIPIGLKSICLVLNNDCNLKCSYCFANKGLYDNPHKQMQFDTAKKSIDMLIESAKKNKFNKISIAFFGGEPLLSFDLIKKCVYYVENLKDNIICEYKITTNATLFNMHIIKFMEKYKFNVMISVDGTKNIHDFYRKYKNDKGSYNDVVNSITMFKEKKLLNARITITDINPLIHSYIDNILQLGFERITFAVDYDISYKAFNQFCNSLNILINKYYNDIVNGKYYDITNFSSIILMLALHTKKFAFCNAGLSYLTISADGKIYRCPRFIGNSTYSIGMLNERKKIIENIKSFKINLKSSSIERNKECNKCVYAYICGGMCYHHAVIKGTNEFDNIHTECYQKKLIYDNLIRLICKLSKIDRRNLLLYYTKLWKSIQRR